MINFIPCNTDTRNEVTCPNTYELSSQSHSDSTTNLKLSHWLQGNTARIEADPIRYPMHTSSANLQVFARQQHNGRRQTHTRTYFYWHRLLVRVDAWWEASVAAGAVGAGAAGAALALAVVLRGLLHLEVAAHAWTNVKFLIDLRRSCWVVQAEL